MSGFSGHNHTSKARRRISEFARRRENVAKLILNNRRWREQNPEKARAIFRREGIKTCSKPGHVERMLANVRMWEQAHPEQTHRNAVMRGFKVAHFTRLCHEKKANPRCPFCDPDGTEVKS
jgi:hypothetical protein